MASTYLSDTHGSTGNRRIFTHSFWLKRASITGGGGTAQYIFHDGFGYLSGDWDFIAFNDDNIQISELDSNASAYAYNLKTNTVYRDLNAWYHIVIAFDTTQATSSDRIKLWVNGEQVTSFGTSTYPSQNFETQVNVGSNPLRIGNSTGSQYFNGSMTHYHFIDGTAYDASAFGETDATTGIWKPKTAPSVTYGTNGFFLKFENSGTMGTDSSPNGNNFTVNGSLTQTVDTPSNVFATLNGINVGGGNSTLSNGNTTYSLSNFSYNTRSTLGMPSGKFYWEQKVNATSDVRIGLCTSGFTTNLDTDNANAYYGGSGGGGVYVLNSAPSTSWQRTNNDTSRNIDTYSTAIASGSTSILMGAVDVDAGKLWVGVDGVWMNSGNPATGANAQITFTNNSGDELQIFAGYGTSSARVSSFNFGNGYFGTTAVASAGLNGNGAIFEYDVPTGYYALNTKNINTYG
jgi:hypothetical protein